MQEFAARESGLGSYLGERWKAETQRFEEVYGQWVHLRFSLDLYGPKKGGEAELSEAFDRLCTLLSEGAVLGLSVMEWKFGELEYDRSCDMGQKGAKRRKGRRRNECCLTILLLAGQQPCHPIRKSRGTEQF